MKTVKQLEPVYISFDKQPTLQDELQRNAWVYTAVSRISSTVASVPLVLERKTRKGWSAMTKHPLQKLLNQPGLSERWAQHLLLSGNALFHLKETEIIPLSPSQIILQGEDYIWTTDEKECLLNSSEVIHWQLPNPENTRWGISPLHAAHGTMNLEKSMSERGKKALADDVQEAIILSDKFGSDQIKMATQLIKEQWEARGKAPPYVLAGVTNIKTMGQFSKELDILHSKRCSREEIAAALGIPMILLHTDGATRESLMAAEAVFWVTRISPLLKMYCQGLEAALLPRFKLGSNWRIRPDTSEVRALQDQAEVAALKKTEAETQRLKVEVFEKLIVNGVSPRVAMKTSGLVVKTMNPWLYIRLALFLLVGLVMVAKFFLKV